MDQSPIRCDSYACAIPLILKNATVIGSKDYIRKATERLIEFGADLVAILASELEMDNVDRLQSMSDEEFKGVRNTVNIPQLWDALSDNYQVAKHEYYISCTDNSLKKLLDTDDYKPGIKVAIDHLMTIKHKIAKSDTLGFIIVDMKVKNPTDEKEKYLKSKVQEVLEYLADNFPTRR